MRRIAAIAGLLGVLVALGVAQLVLPGVAADRISVVENPLALDVLAAAERIRARTAAKPAAPAAERIAREQQRRIAELEAQSKALNAEIERLKANK